MPINQSTKVIKRDGSTQTVSFDKILHRLSLLSTGVHKNGIRFGHELNIDVTPISQQVISKIYDGVTTKELDELAASTCADMVKEHPDYADLAGRIIISNQHKNTGGSFVDTIKHLYSNRDGTGKASPMINNATYKAIIENREYFESLINYDRDFLIDYFGFKTLERAYLLTAKAGHLQIQERPQHMYLRVAAGMWGSDLENVKETYELLSTQKLSHASPTLYNSGTPHNQNSSCFLLGMDDSLSNIYDCLKKCAMISKHAGGIGIWAHRVRAQNSRIRGTNGKSDGLIPMLRVFNETARYVNQGGKRKGSIAVYLEPHHADVEDFLDLKKQHGDMSRRALDLFLAMWISDLFMKRLDQALPDDKSVMWSLFCPDEAPGLEEVYGDDYEKLYTQYEKEQRQRKQIPILDLWEKILSAQKETGVPYMLYKDCVNYRNAQMNIGVVKSSNLCVAGETMILTNQGYYPIQSLLNQSVEVWNGEEFSQTRVCQTGEDQSMLNIAFSNGSTLKCTEYHKFYIQTNEIKQYAANELEVGMKLIKCDYPTITKNKERYKQAYIRGAYCAENGKRDEELSKSINKIEVPLNYCLDDKLEWLAGYADLDGIMNGRRLQINRTDDIFLNNVKLMLQTMGCNPEVILSQKNQTYQLLIDANDLFNLKQSGFKPRHLVIINNRSMKNLEKFITIKSIEQSNEKMDTFCFKEQKRGMGIFNGVITGQCAEIALVNDPKDDTISVCNLAAVPLGSFVKHNPEADHPTGMEFDFGALSKSVEVGIRNLNRIIDVNFYPVEDCAKSNFRDRPVGLGVVGLYDVFMKLRYNFDSLEAQKLNAEIFECMYYVAVKTSMELAKKDGAYETFAGSPASKGKLQLDLWNEDRVRYGHTPTETCGRYDWDQLRKDVVEHGLRNSTLMACMPTASTAQIIGQTESFECMTYNMYRRQVLSGDFKLVNKYLQRDLIKLGLWNSEMADRMLASRGSIQDFEDIPVEIRKLYRGAFEIKQKVMLDLAIGRSAYIDQMQSLNIFLKEPTNQVMTSIQMYAFKHRLKTGSYYYRREAKGKAISFTSAPVKAVRKKITSRMHERRMTEKRNAKEAEPQLCLLSNPDCEACQV